MVNCNWATTTILFFWILKFEVKTLESYLKLEIPLYAMHVYLILYIYLYVVLGYSYTLVLASPFWGIMLHTHCTLTQRIPVATDPCNLGVDV